MHTLHITVAGKVATYSARDGSIICGNDDYQVQFALDSEWDGLAAKARFRWNGKHKDVPIVDGLAAVPRITNAHEVKVGVYSEDGSLKTTTAARVPCNKSILCGDSAPTEGNEAHYASEAQKAADRAEAAAERAEAAGGNGGTGGGVVIDPESVNQAQEAAQAAQESAEAAADSAQAAGQSAEEAETSKSQATAAQRAAEAAQRAAEAAESGAAQKATDAGNAAQTAASKATEATEAKEAAETAQGKAEGARDTAVANAEAASTSATVAAREAGNASKSSAAAATDRTAAETAAGTATSAKTAAESARDTASQKATEANEATTAAQTAKGEAQTAATNAGKSATAAAGSATTASNAATAAQTAQGKAETAQATAESAKSTASQKATEATNAAQTATSKAAAASQSATAAGTAQAAAEAAAARAEEAANRLLGVAVVGVIETVNGAPSLVLTSVQEVADYTAYYKVVDEEGNETLVEIGQLVPKDGTEPDPVTYTIRWVNYDDTVLEIDEKVPEGVTPEYNGATPTKPADTQYTYTFKGWDKAVVAAVADATYTATYTQTAKPAEPVGPTNYANPSDAMWQVNNRLATSSGNGKTDGGTGHILTNFVPAKLNDEIYVTGLDLKAYANGKPAAVGIYTNNTDPQTDYQRKYALTGVTGTANVDGAGDKVTATTANGVTTYVYKILEKNNGDNLADSNTAYIRIDGIAIEGVADSAIVINVKRDGEWL